MTEEVPTRRRERGPYEAPTRAEMTPNTERLGHGSLVGLMDFIRAVEAATGKKAICDYQPMQPGDVPCTWADTEALFAATGYRPRVKVEEGARRFVEWYRGYYGV